MKKNPQLPALASSDLPNPPTTNSPAIPSAPSGAPIEPSPLNSKFLVPPQPGSRPRTPGSFSSVPFAALPLYIPNIRTPYVGYHGALNIAATEVHKELGVLFVLPTYLGRAEFDLLELFYGDPVNPVANYTINQDDVDQERPIPLYVPYSRIIQGPVNPVFVRVTIFGGGTAETLHLNLFVDLVRPAGRNPIASTVQNENLAKPEFPQHLIDFGVGQDDIGVPIPVRIKPYPINTTLPADTFRKPRDRIRLSIGGRIRTHSVTEGEASGTDDIVISLNTSDWTAIGSGSHVFEYEVVDESGNHSDGWSIAQILDVRLNDGSEPLLPAAFVQEAPENILNHDTLVGDAHIFIFISGNGYALGDILRVTLNGRTVEGEPLVTSYDSLPLTSTTAFYLTVLLPNADVKALVGGRFQLSYKRVRSGVPDRPSRSNIVDVIGTELPVGLVSPYFIEAGGSDILDPQELFFNAVIPKYAGQNFFDLVTLILVGTYANGTPYYREYDDIAGDGDGLRLIPNGPNGDIAKLEGGTLRIYYLVENEQGLRPSQDQLYNVGQPAASLAEPQVLEAPKPRYQFDPSVSLGNASVRVLADADIKAGDTVRLYAMGNAAGGTPSIAPFPVTAFWEGRTLPFTLPRANVIANTAMRIYYARERENAPTRFSHEVRMGVGAKLDVPAPQVLEATVTGPNKALLNPRHVLTPPDVTIRVISDKFPSSAEIKVFITGMPGIGMPDIPAKPARPEPGTNYTDFRVPNTFVPAYLGKHCTVYYNLMEVGKTTKSEDLELSVGTFTQDELDLITIPQAPGNVIVKNEGNEVEINEWPFFARTQEVFIDLVTSTNHPLRTGTKVSASEFIAKRTQDAIPASIIEAIPSGEKLDIQASVSMDGSGRRDTAMALKTTRYSVKKNAEIIAYIPIGAGFHQIEITPDSRKAFVLNFASKTVTAINLETNTVVATLSTPTCYAISLSGDGTKLYAGEFVSWSASSYNYIKVFSTGDYSLITTMWSSYGAPEQMGATTGADSRIYSSSIQTSDQVSYKHRLMRINPNNNTFDREVILNERPGKIYTSPENTLFIRSETTNFRRFDTQSNTFLANAPFNKTVRDIAFSQTDNKGFYADRTSVGVFNRLLNTPLTTRTDFTFAEGLATHPTRKELFVLDAAENTVRIFNTSTDTLEFLGSVGGFSGPTLAKVSPNGRRLYVVNSAASVLAVVDI